ncbi:MAG: MFS transporter, partial [Methanomassiliicoccales archaeon]
MVVDAERGFNLGSILTITFLGHMMVHTYMLTFPMIMTFLVEEFGASYVILGIIYTLSNLAFGLGAIGAGYLADRVGSKRLIALSAGGMGFSALLAGLTVNLETLTLSLFLLGAFASLYHPASFTLISKAARE